MAVLPKLFWLNPAVAFGDPPVIRGEELPGQQESVATDWPSRIAQDVQEHFARASQTEDQIYRFFLNMIFFFLCLSLRTCDFHPSQTTCWCPEPTLPCTLWVLTLSRGRDSIALVRASSVR